MSTTAAGTIDLTEIIVKAPLIACSLEIAVPMWVERLQRQPWSYVESRARECCQIVAEKGDIILYRSNKKGESAAAFNALAEGVAALSFVPGGIRNFFGTNFHAQHPELPDTCPCKACIKRRNETAVPA